MYIEGRELTGISRELKVRGGEYEEGSLEHGLTGGESGKVDSGRLKGGEKFRG